MQIERLEYDGDNWLYNTASLNADIVFAFGDREACKTEESFKGLKRLYPKAQIVGCSSSGNIQGDSLSSASMVADAVAFESGYIHTSVEDFTEDNDDHAKVVERLIEKLPKEKLKHIFLLVDGLNMNGSSLALGANMAVDYKIPITGGLAGDGTDFEETWIIANGSAKQNRIVAVGFYGDSLSVKSGCFAGWEEFGILRNITKSIDNIVYEIDNQPALSLYKKYLGEYAKDLPASGLRFPIGIKKDKHATPTARTLVAINENDQSLIFADDVPQGSLSKLMKTDIDRLIDGAEIAASHAKEEQNKTALGLMVSCVVRRMLLKQLTDEELETVGKVLGSNVELVGFYSYGELAPFSDELLSCKLHNLTLTLTVVYEE